MFKHGLESCPWKKDKVVLESLVQRAVVSLQEAPCLHLVSEKDSCQTVAVPPSVEVVPQVGSNTGLRVFFLVTLRNGVENHSQSEV